MSTPEPTASDTNTEAEATNTEAEATESVAETPSLASKLSGRTIKDLVGPDKQEWLIHERLLCSTSEFFVKALQGPFKESGGSLELPAEELDAFEVFVKWIYTKACHPDLEIQLLAKITSEPDMFMYLKAYVFASKYLITGLEDELLKEVHAYLTRDPVNGYKMSDQAIWYPSMEGSDVYETVSVIRPLAVDPQPDHFTYIFGNTLTNSKIRPLLTDHFLTHVSYNSLSSEEKERFMKIEEDLPEFGSCILDSMFRWASNQYHDRSKNTNNKIRDLEVYR
ncbi:hypothetical protein QBC43DRAFT_316579 [Cladorrhinum sp. PSN259]|nr:hypothetical protein QBC43DRAFT_316579 [Cladorrhinum sp. PSN259]